MTASSEPKGACKDAGMRIEAGTRAIVTGASRGIGRALCEALGRRGARLGLLARDREQLEELAGELPAAGTSTSCWPPTSADRREVEAAVARFAKRAGGLDLLVANAGIAHYGPFADVEIEKAEEMVRINVLGTLYTVEAARPADARRAPAATSWSSPPAPACGRSPGAPSTAATKAFDRGFAEALRHELSGTGVSVTTVFPGEVETALHDHQRDRLPDWRRDENTIPPAEVAADVVEAVEADRREVHSPRR